LVGGLRRHLGLGADRGNAAATVVRQVPHSLHRRGDVVDRDVVELNPRGPLTEQDDRRGPRFGEFVRAERQRAEDHAVNEVRAHALQRHQLACPQAVCLLDQHGPRVRRSGGDHEARHLSEVGRVELREREGDQASAAAAEIAR
jgi:hypothetical protein